MNSIKTVVMVTVLLVVGVAVYRQINSTAPPPAPPQNANPGSPVMNIPGAAGTPQGPKSGATTPAWAGAPGLGTAGTPGKGDFGAPPAPWDRNAAAPPAPTGSDRSVLAPPAGPPPPADRGMETRPAVEPRPGEPLTGQPGEGPTARPADGLPGAPPGGPSGRPDPAAPAASPSGVSKEFLLVMQNARKRLDEGALADVHRTLSKLYDHPSLAPEESRQLTELLDQLAGTVIYSRQPLLEAAYKVRPGETLQDIAQGCRVPWQLLAKINGISDPRALQSGQELKLIRGPFEAVITLSRYELLLKADGCYAGRFAIGLGTSRQLEGAYTVQEKLPGKPYQGLAAADPNNPLGQRWIGLGGEMGIHGTNNPANVGRSGGPGTICLSAREIEDVFDILSEGSLVTIKR